MIKKPHKKGTAKGYHVALQWAFDEYEAGIAGSVIEMIAFIYGKTPEQIRIDLTRCKKAKR